MSHTSCTSTSHLLVSVSGAGAPPAGAGRVPAGAVWGGGRDAAHFVHVNFAPFGGRNLAESAKLRFYWAPAGILLKQSDVVFEERWINPHE